MRAHGRGRVEDDLVLLGVVGERVHLEEALLVGKRGGEAGVQRERIHLELALGPEYRLLDRRLFGIHVRLGQRILERRDVTHGVRELGRAAQRERAELDTLLGRRFGELLGEAELPAVRVQAPVDGRGLQRAPVDVQPQRGVPHEHENEVRAEVEEALRQRVESRALLFELLVVDRLAQAEPDAASELLVLGVLEQARHDLAELVVLERELQLVGGEPDLGGDRADELVEALALGAVAEFVAESSVKVRLEDVSVRHEDVRPWACTHRKGRGGSWSTTRVAGRAGSCGAGSHRHRHGHAHDGLLHLRAPGRVSPAASPSLDKP